MKERPIIFSAEMVRALLEGRKTQTRRVVTLPNKRVTKKYGDVEVRNVCYWSPPSGSSQADWGAPGVNYHTFCKREGHIIGNHTDPCPYGQPGDRLWVREAFWQSGRWANTEDETGERGREWEGGQNIKYCATDEQIFTPLWRKFTSIHMPRSASRIDLEITNIRVERLQDISAQDAIAEGIDKNDYAWRNYLEDIKSEKAFGLIPQDSFGTLWKKINGPDSWTANPWVWVIEFKEKSRF